MNSNAWSEYCRRARKKPAYFTGNRCICWLACHRRRLGGRRYDAGESIEGAGIGRCYRAQRRTHAETSLRAASVKTRMDRQP